MEFTNEQLARAVSAKTPEELKTIAAAEKIDFSDEEAEYYFGLLHEASAAELDADELASIVGGGLFGDCNEGWVKPKFKVGQRIIWSKGKSLSCYGTITSVSNKKRLAPDGNKEWTYSIDLGRGWTEKYVFEHELSPW